MRAIPTAHDRQLPSRGALKTLRRYADWRDIHDGADRGRSLDIVGMRGFSWRFAILLMNEGTSIPL